jgi:indole-3-glycerol phosphate synthase
MLTEYQVDEARCAGADAILLIVAALEAEALESLYRRGRDRGLDVLVEVHDEAELEVAIDLGANLIGVNNRNLHSFEVDLAVTERLAARIAGDLDVLLVAESGIHTLLDTERLGNAGARGFLVGESLMREPNIELALRRLRGTE